jgi:hypothetical protein
MPLAGYQAVIRRAVGPTTATSLGTTLVSGTTYRITTASTRVVDPTQTWCITVNAVTITPASVSADLLFGEFTIPTPVTTPVFVGSYLSLDLTSGVDTVQEVKSHSIEDTREILDVTVYTAGTRPFKKKTLGLRDVSWSMDMLTGSTNTSYLATSMFNGSRVFVDMKNSASVHFRALGFVEKMSNNTEVAGLVETTVDFKVSCEESDPHPHIFTAVSERLI